MQGGQPVSGVEEPRVQGLLGQCPCGGVVGAGKEVDWDALADLV